MKQDELPMPPDHTGATTAGGTTTALLGVQGRKPQHIRHKRHRRDEMEGYEDGYDDTPADIRDLKSQLSEIEAAEAVKRQKVEHDAERKRLRERIMALGHDPRR